MIIILLKNHHGFHFHEKKIRISNEQSESLYFEMNTFERSIE